MEIWKVHWIVKKGLELMLILSVILSPTSVLAEGGTYSNMLNFWDVESWFTTMGDFYEKHLVFHDHRFFSGSLLTYAMGTGAQYGTGSWVSTDLFS